MKRHAKGIPEGVMAEICYEVADFWFDWAWRKKKEIM